MRNIALLMLFDLIHKIFYNYNFAVQYFSWHNLAETSSQATLEDSYLFRKDVYRRSQFQLQHLNSAKSLLLRDFQQILTLSSACHLASIKLYQASRIIVES